MKDNPNYVILKKSGLIIKIPVWNKSGHLSNLIEGDKSDAVDCHANHAY